MDIKEQIGELAKFYVCPMTRTPTTPNEIGAVKQYTAFALMVLEQLGLGYFQDDLDEEIKVWRESNAQHD